MVTTLSSIRSDPQLCIIMITLIMIGVADEKHQKQRQTFKIHSQSSKMHKSNLNNSDDNSIQQDHASKPYPICKITTKQEDNDRDDDKLETIIEEKSLEQAQHSPPTSQTEEGPRTGNEVDEATNSESRSFSSCESQSELASDKIAGKEVAKVCLQSGNNEEVNDNRTQVPSEVDKSILKDSPIMRPDSVEITISSEIADDDELNPTGWVRHAIAWLALSSILLANINRQAFNQALTDMNRPNGSSPFLPNGEPDGKVDWSATQTDDLKKFFALGYALFMIPGGRLCELLGTKWIVFTSGFGSGICSLLVPWLADSDYFTLLKWSRFIMGVCQTAVSPALFAIISRWLTDSESNFYLPLLKSGVMFGFLFGTAIAGITAWRVCFYFCGIITLIWCSIWVFFVSSLPRDNKFITPEELAFIEQELRKRAGEKATSTMESATTTKPDGCDIEKTQLDMETRMSRVLKACIEESKLWLKIFSNYSVLAVMATKWTLRLSTDMQTQFLPDFLNNIHHLSKFDNSLANSVNYAIQGVYTFFIIWLAKYCLTNKVFGLNKTGIRRMFQCLCSFGMAAAYLLIALDICSLNVTLSAIILLSLANTLCAGSDSMMPYDLSPTYSGTIMAVANSFANTTGYILPEIATATLGNDRENPDKWRVMLLIASGLIALGGVVFSVVVKAKIQSFDPSWKAQKRKDLLAKEQKEATNEVEDEKTIEKLEMRPIKLYKIPSHSYGMTDSVARTNSKLSQLTFEEWRQRRQQSNHGDDDNKTAVQDSNPDLVSASKGIK